MACTSDSCGSHPAAGIQDLQGTEKEINMFIDALRKGPPTPHQGNIPHNEKVCCDAMCATCMSMALQRYSDPGVCQVLPTLKARSLLQLAIRHSRRQDWHRVISSLSIPADRRREMLVVVAAVINWYEVHHCLLGDHVICFIPFIHWTPLMDQVDYYSTAKMIVKNIALTPEIRGPLAVAYNMVPDAADLMNQLSDELQEYWDDRGAFLRSLQRMLYPLMIPQHAPTST